MANIETLDTVGGKVNERAATVARPVVRLTAAVAEAAEWDREAQAAWTAALWCAAGAWDYEHNTPLNPVLRAAVCDTIHEGREEV